MIASHGLVEHMNKYNRDTLAREITPECQHFRCEFHLDPTRSSWSDSNPSCTLLVSYNADPNGARTAEDGSTVMDSFLRIRVGASGSDMDSRMLKSRESMVTMLSMLVEMLETMLPEKVTSLLETSAVAAERVQREAEQVVGRQIFDNLGEAAFKGLRAGGSARSFRLTPTYSSADGKFPSPGTYRFKHVRYRDRKGYPKEVVHYSIRVYGGGDGSLPPSVSIRRVEAV